MPTCTGNIKSSGCWVCPECGKRKEPIKCLTAIEAEDEHHGVPVHCNSPCRFYIRFFDNPGDLIVHMREIHGILF